MAEKENHLQGSFHRQKNVMKIQSGLGITGTVHRNNIFESDLLVFNISYETRSNLQASERVQLFYISPKALLKKKNNPLMETRVTKF